MTTLPTLYPLKHPVEIKAANGDGSRTISSVELRRPLGRDLLLFDQYEGKPMALMIAMISALSDLSEPEVRRLDAEDVVPLGELALSSVGDGPVTGATA